MLLEVNSQKKYEFYIYIETLQIISRMCSLQMYQHWSGQTSDRTSLKKNVSLLHLHKLSLPRNSTFLDSDIFSAATFMTLALVLKLKITWLCFSLFFLDCCQLPTTKKSTR